MTERTPHREPDVDAVLDLLWKWDFAGLADRRTAAEEYDVLCDQVDRPGPRVAAVDAGLARS